MSCYSVLDLGKGCGEGFICRIGFISFLWLSTNTIQWASEWRHFNFIGDRQSALIQIRLLVWWHCVSERACVKIKMISYMVELRNFQIMFYEVKIKWANYNFSSQTITRFSNTPWNFNSLQLARKLYFSFQFHLSTCWSRYVKWFSSQVTFFS